MQNALARTIKIALAIVAAGSLPATALALPITIGFEQPYPEPPGSQSLITQYTEAGFVFQNKPSSSIPPQYTTPYMVRTSSGGFLPDNGTSYLQLLYGDSLVFGPTDGSPFRLVSMDLAEYSTVFPVPVTIPVVGERADGTTVDTVFVTDGQIDGSGPLPDFQTFSLPASFNQLTQVRIPVDSFSIDNVVVDTAPIPEPSGAWSFLAGLLLVTTLSRHGVSSKRKRRDVIAAR